jgi:hypothetical protein
MSAQEVIEQIKALPPEEQRVVEEFVQSGLERARQLSSSDAVTSQQEVRYVEKATFEAAMEVVFAKHDELFRRLAQ